MKYPHDFLSIFTYTLRYMTIIPMSEVRQQHSERPGTASEVMGTSSLHHADRGLEFLGLAGVDLTIETGVSLLIMNTSSSLPSVLIPWLI